MSQQFKEQGGAATMDPTPSQRWLTSRLAMLMNSEGRFENAGKRPSVFGKKRVAVTSLITSIKLKMATAI